MIESVPNLIIIGDISYDINKFYYEDGSTKIRTNFGGSSVYASIPASMFYRVGLVSNAGQDINIDLLKKFLLSSVSQHYPIIQDFGNSRYNGL